MVKLDSEHCGKVVHVLTAAMSSILLQGDLRMLSWHGRRQSRVSGVMAIGIFGS